MQGLHCRVTKLGRLRGRPEGNSPIGPMTAGYTVTGHLLETPAVGHSLKLIRYERNGVRVTGLFETSPIENFGIRDDVYIVETENSVYELQVLPPLLPAVIVIL